MQAFPGPAVANSATGQNLAQGPRGKRGPQGLPGLPGPSGIPVVGTQTIAFTSLSKLVVIGGQGQIVAVDTSGGAFDIMAPAQSGCLDGQEWGALDPSGYWGTNRAGVTVRAGEYIQDPSNPMGPLVTNGTILLPAAARAGAAWVLLLAYNLWALRP